MTAPDLTTCPHGKRAGIAVCLYCRQDARIAAKQRRNKAAVRIAVIGLGGAALLALVVGGLVAVVPRGRSADSVTAAPPAAPEPSTTRSRAEPLVRPIVAEGRTELGDSVFAERAGGEVTVHFDTELLRTRLDEKFERVVRLTLPKVYGPEVSARLDSVSPGQFVRGGNLLTDLPSRGIALTLPAHNRTLMLYPVTRQGQEGPIVVGYRTTVAK
jgi:hypothetical protein